MVFYLVAPDAREEGRMATSQRGRWRIAAVAVCASLCGGGAALAGPDATRLAQSCTSCHGSGSDTPLAIPPLVGRDAHDLQARMTELAAGYPDATIMPRILRDYDPDEIAALAAWFAEAKP